MAKLKKLLSKDDVVLEVTYPVSEEELENRHKDYNVLSPKQFGTKYRNLLFKPIEFNLFNKSYLFQYNFCTNPYCKWQGLQQKKFDVKGKPDRYRLDAANHEQKQIKCNPDPIQQNKGAEFNCKSVALSNWSIAEEIHRLIRINSVMDDEPVYNFHKEGCPQQEQTPFESPSLFYRQGKSSSTGAQQWQCRACRKKTTLRPGSKQSVVYKQKRSEINLLFTKLLLNKEPITRACEVLGIADGTYYDKLEFVYRRCLEFLERNETKPLQDKEFKEMWINTDKMTYYLNNVRKKGMGGSKYNDVEDSVFPTNVVISADAISRYVFRSDVSYDWDVTLDEIQEDTIQYKDDHVGIYARKNARFTKFSYYPQPPSAKDTQTKTEYNHDLSRVERRTKYTEGLHVNSTYTSIAHYWLIKELVNASEWRFITDEDSSLITAIFRVFAKEIRLSDGHHFLCQSDKTKSRKQARQEFAEVQSELLEWADFNGIKTKKLRDIAKLKLEKLFETHHFHKEVKTSTGTHLEYADNPIEHPLATIDRGYRSVDCTTNLSSLEPKDIAELMLNVNDNASNSFIQQIRRRLSILERPLTAARGDQKSYIYANFNPKYAQMAITILRTYYNFCLPYKTGKVNKTPSQRLGIVEKVFELKDILYLR
ncbi:insertion element protein [Fictibacillus nanhaiensis]|uniref:insertion element protein n=1 Tax=Fictibacillus nanhaiensis TaxID=742169 RepID=UPI00203C82C5|nr:insertion element protein [Fictibacillus nanhaiensis]MCM3730625.1 insertion element protein [Fictibacillus nanhaiensis]